MIRKGVKSDEDLSKAGPTYRMIGSSDQQRISDNSINEVKENKNYAVSSDV